MRLPALLAFLVVASAPSGGCSSDGTSANIPHGQGGLYANGSPGAASSEADPAGDAGSGDTGAGAVVSVGPSAAVPATTADAGAAAVDEDASAVSDGAVAPRDAGCACGCTDPCLTELIAACKAPTVLLLAVCPKVPATCACDAVCTTPPPTLPTLDVCVAQFLLTGG